jgi:hypothetical protein
MKRGHMQTIDSDLLDTVTGGLFGAVPVAKDTVRLGNFIIGRGDGNPGGLHSMGGGSMPRIPSATLGKFLSLGTGR